MHTSYHIIFYIILYFLYNILFALSHTHTHTGAMTVTGSLVAYAKLAEKMSSVQILLYIIMIYKRICAELVMYMYIYANEVAYICLLHWHIYIVYIDR